MTDEAVYDVGNGENRDALHFRTTFAAQWRVDEEIAYDPEYVCF
jgi:hypothetical protein